MRGSLAKARVLFAPVEEIGSEDRLLRACRIQIFIYTNKEKEEYYLLKLGLNFFCHLNKFFWISWAFLEVIIDAYVEAGLVLEKDANKKLKV